MIKSTCMSKAFARRMVVWAGIVTLLGVLFAFYSPAASGTKPRGPVTIETFVDFTVYPFQGTFEVLQGDDILGCEGGVSVDTWHGGLKSEFTCDSGPGAGDTFTVRFEGWVGFYSGGNANDHWRVVEGTGYFATLHGQGDHFLEFVDGDDYGISTFTGKVHFDPN